MNKAFIHNNILEAMREKVPDKPALTALLMDLLCMEKESVYRRLRGDVVFSFAEIAMISNALGFSLDNIVSSTLSKQSKPFQLKLVNYYDPSEVDYAMMQQYIDILIGGKDDPHSELMDCTNILPPVLYGGYKNIEQLLIFKGMYQSGNTSLVHCIKEAKCPDRMDKMIRKNLWLTKQFKSSCYILDPLVFQYIVSDIMYFNSIDMIDTEDRLALKEELMALIVDLEQLAATGVYRETGNKVSLYIGSVNFNISYWSVDINNYHLAMIKAFVLNNFASLDEHTYRILKARIMSLQRSSTMISISGERMRKLFFDKQREIIAQL